MRPAESDSEASDREEPERSLEKSVDPGRQEDNPDHPMRFFETVRETAATSDQDAEDDDPSGEESDRDDADSEREVPSSPKQVNIADFDDEEEFLLAGGQVGEAQKRKEW